MTSTLVKRALRHDVEVRSRLIFNSIKDQVAVGLAAGGGANLVSFLERLTEDEQLLALGFCRDGALEHATKDMPKSMSCDGLARITSTAFVTTYSAGHRLLVGVFPMNAGLTRGHLVILHDLTFVAERVSQARFYTALAVIIGVVGVGLVALASVLAV